ncbi:unnamed protein product [Bubo scandiacus]
MATGKIHRSMGSSKMADGLQSKVAVRRYPKLVREAEQRMSLTTKQRLASTREMRRPRITQLLDMGEASHHKFSAVDLEQSLFQPFPSEVVFQNYVPFEVYEVPLILRNTDKVPRLVKVVLETSPYFKLTSPGGVCCKVAPGMCSTYRIQFTPEENKDYFYQLTCITEREKFIVPIRAIGARAVLDFPDQLNFSVCPVKYSSQKTLLVRNIGNREARYRISTESPFSVDPSIGTLGIGDAMQVTVEFHPLKTGDHSSSLVVHYDTGEDIHTSLYGAAVDVNIRLARSSLTVEKTYLTLSNHRSVVIHNRSEIIVHFQWKAFVTQEEEDYQKLRLQRQKEDEMDRCLRECKVEPALRERLSLLSRPFQNQRAKAQGDSMLFSDDVFTLEPLADKCSRWRIEPSEGVIPPETEVSVAVIANLDDTEKFKDEVNLFIENSHTYVIPVRAVGIGTTIVTDKPFAPELNLGPHFSLDPCCYHFKITNEGRRTHRLYWSTEGFGPFHQRDRVPAVSTTQGQGSFQSPRPACPVFKVQPQRVELMPGKTMEMVLEGFSSTPQVVKERLLCHAVVGSKAGKAPIMQVDVTCEFIAPVLQMSSREITFRVEKQPSDVLTLQYQPLSLRNASSLPLSIVLALEQPFLICGADQQPLSADVQPMKLEIGEELHLSIRFNPAYEEDLCTRVVEKVLKIRFLEHPHEEQVTVRGEVYFPNLHIQPTALDFGCILNDTEGVRYIEMTNCSPLLVQYHWAFLMDSHVSQMRFSPPVPKFFIKPQPPKEEGARSKRSVSAGSSCRDGGVEEPAKALGAAGDPAQEPADADDSLESKLLPSTAVELEGAVETQSLVGINKLMQFVEAEPVTLGMEEVFDVLPLYGVLQPGESQRVMFTFFGHTNIVAHVMALCRVEGGPTYEIALSGEASLINYLLDVTEIDCGLQLFNKVTEAEVTLQNSGKMGFTYVVLRPSAGTADSPLPGVPLVLPSTGYVGPGQAQVLKVYYLPGVPGAFCRTFQIQVGHLEPEEISLKGEGSFPRIYLDLPRNIKGNEKYEKVLKEVIEKMEDSQREEAVVLGEAVAAEPPPDPLDAVLDPRLQMQMEQMLMEEHALEQQKALTSGPPEATAFDQHARRRLLKAELPEYLLDFGYVILGNTPTHVVRITNTGQFPVSFRADRRVLRDTGNHVDLDHVKHLLCCETKVFEVRFDPQSANLPLGEVDVLLPIKVAGGPTFHVRLHASVAVPSLCVSRDRLEFSTLQCGQCQEETVQLHNQLQVPCNWLITINEPVKKVKHRQCVTPRMRRKVPQKLKAQPCVFEALPSAGALAPGQRCNVRVRFSPTEEKSYRSELKINIFQSSQHLQLQVSGRGLEPQLEFSPLVLELGPLLPYSCGAEGTVVVKNPCEFPIEFYSLEFDQQYLAEEQILQTLKDYDCHNTLLLPPRAPGEKLPPEVLEYYQDQKRLQDEQTKSKTGEPAGQDNGEGLALAVLKHRQSTSSSKAAAGELADSPVYRAIARHLGIDISAEGRAARNRRGIVVIIHGAPLTGKTAAAVALSRYYGAACLSIDTVVREAISDRSSSAGLRARELCIRAAIEQSCKEAEGAASVPSTGHNADASLSLQFDMRRSSSVDKLSLRSVRSRGQVSAAAGKKKTDGPTPQSQKQHLMDLTGSQELCAARGPAGGHPL